METNKPLIGPVALWKSAYKLFKQHYQTILPLFGFLALVDLWTLIGNLDGQELSVRTGGAGIVSALYSLFLAAAVAYRVSGDKEATKRAVSKLWTIFWTSILVGIMMILGFVALIIPGILIAVWSSQTTYAIIFENKSGLSAYKRSKELVKGRFWPVLGRLMFVVLPVIPISIIGAILLPGAIIGSLLTTMVYMPIVLIYEYLLYRNLSETA